MLPALVRPRIFGLTLLCVTLSATFGAQNQPIDLDLTAHEWGTFTSIAGGDGLAEKWSTLNGSAVLPHFVDHVSGPQAKAGLLGTARMETPVLYFYSPHEVTVSVKVKFSKGLITEWYLQASRVKPDPEKVLDREALYRRHGGGSIAWDSVTVSPNLAPGFPRENEGNQYYAARKTSAAPLVVKTAAGDQQERFLFYRGVSTFSVPISATVTPEGNLRIKNLAQEEISSVILFERRGDKVGYRIGGGLQSEMSLDPPELTATFDSMSRDLQDILTGQGLYPDEAHAMIETWRQSWFEEGSRLFYVVPHDFLNAIVPLTINPAPAQTVRVFVGRLELVTPATAHAVEKILATHDIQGLRTYRRFLDPIVEELKAENPARAEQIEKDLELTYESPMVQAQTAK
jgi:hypothetical protein